jgi:hypothetical protein
MYFDAIILIIVIISLTILSVVGIKKLLKNNNIDKQIDEILNKESFIVADAQDFHNYDKLRDKVLKESPTFDDPPSDRKDDEFSMQMTYGVPKKVDIRPHPRSFVTAADYGWDAPFPTVSCSNSSIDDRYKTGPKQIIPNQIACGSPDKLTAENYYKTHFQAPVAYLNDNMVRGWNYEIYSSFIHPTKSNIRILSQNTKGLPPNETKYRNIPSGANYAFHNTPSMPMP